MSKPVKAADITFTVKFEDGKTAQMTAIQIAQMKEKRRYEVVDPRGNVVFKKTFRGL